MKQDVEYIYNQRADDVARKETRPIICLEKNDIERSLWRMIFLRIHPYINEYSSLWAHRSCLYEHLRNTELVYLKIQHIRLIIDG